MPVICPSSSSIATKGMTGEGDTSGSRIVVIRPSALGLVTYRWHSHVDMHLVDRGEAAHPFCGACIACHCLQCFADVENKLGNELRPCCACWPAKHFLQQDMCTQCCMSPRYKSSRG